MMLYRKNLYGWEQLARIAVSLGVAVYALGLMQPGLPAYVLAASAVGFGMTGVIGWCPACAMVGRRLKDKA